MPSFKAYKAVPKTGTSQYRVTINAGGSEEFSWNSDDDYTLHRIHIIEESGLSLFKEDTTVTIDETTLTKEAVPASLFAPDILLSPILDVSLPEDKKFKLTITNNESSAITVRVVLELWK
ncbi:MAG: hypothetical protein ACP5IT_11415 [Thermoproteota archaeon]